MAEAPRMTASPEQDALWMARALDLARRGTSLCSPNPMVGCVILDSSGNLAGEGWHEFEKLDHAEVMALKAAGDRARGGTAYVTDIGMTGPYAGVIGMKKEASLSRFLKAKGERFEVAEGDLQLHAILVVTEGRKAIAIERVMKTLQ